MLTLPAASTALVLIDLQNGIMGFQTQPRSPAEVVAASKAVAQRFRAAGAHVVLVNVDFAPGYADALKAPVDQPSQLPPGGLPPTFADIVEGLAEPGDLRVTKKQWGAFYGTDLDLQLRRRGVTTIVLGGVATNQGVESTARAAHEHGYAVVLAEDLCAGRDAEMHSFAFERIFPHLSRVVKAAEIELAQ